MKRRNFLRNSVGFVSVPLLLRGMPLSAGSSNAFFNAINENNDKVIVLIQMNGGNDGLNTIIPIDQYDILGNARSNILIPENQILKINDSLGFHPEMQRLQEIYDEGKMAIVQDVGYPNQNRSHFRSSDIWTTGSPSNETWTTGWLGRYFENEHSIYPESYPNEDFPDPFALTIGSVVSETCQGTSTNFSLALADPTSIGMLNNDANDEVPNTAYGEELAFLRTSIEQANAYGEVITSAATKGSNANDYPDTDLGRQLASISLLISGGLKTKVYIANIGGFDTHANQVEEGAPTTGEHATLLRNISNAVHAFQEDLKVQNLEEKVVTMTFSEFGRRIRSNGGFGTDHGSAAPMLLFGSCVNAGIIGENPILPDQPQQGEGVQMQFDFRNVYGSLLIDWFDVDSNLVANILGDQFSYLPLVTKCSTTTSTSDIEDLSLAKKLFPNPCIDQTKLEFEGQGTHLRISIFDGLGKEINVVNSRTYSKGRHEITIDTNHLTPGNYYLRIISLSASSTLPFVKIS